MRVIIYLRQWRRYMFLPARLHSSVCLSVCVQDYSKTQSWIWMKCCVSTDVGTWTNWLTFEPDPDYSPDAGTGLLSPTAHCNTEFYYIGKIRIRVGRASLWFSVVCTVTWNLITSGKSHLLVSSLLFSLLFHAGQAAIKLPSAEACKRAQCTSPGQYAPYIKGIMKTP